MLFDLKASKVPQFNESVITTIGTGITTHPSSYAELDFWITRTPELIRIVAAVQEDILGDGVYFDGKPGAVEKAQKFWEDNFVKEELKKSMFDWLLYGDGYLWKGKFGKKELGTMQAKAIDKLPYVPKGFEYKLHSDDEDDINFIRHAPSTTMNIDLNVERTAVKQFRQIVQGEEANVWQPEEIIHAKYWTTKGKVHGFSPAMALIVELQAIGYIKDYATSWFKQGGWPDISFNFPNEQPSSRRVSHLVEQLKKYKHPVEKHGNLVSTGEMKIEKLNEFSKDMEFRQLLIQLTGIIAHAYGLPAGRISSIIGAEVKVSTGSDDLANEAYWNMIGNHKDYWELLLNTQVFSKFGKVKLNFPHTHKVDEVRETQSKVFINDYLTGLTSIGVKYNMKYVKDLLGIKNEHLESQKLEPPMMMENSGFRQNQPNLQNAKKGGGKQAESKQKQKQQKTSNSDKQKLGF